MYETRSLSGMAEKACKPDYEKEAVTQKKELDVIKRFKESLLEFIDVVGTHSLRKDNGIPQLLGTVTIDVNDREKRLAFLLKKLPEWCQQSEEEG